MSFLPKFTKKDFLFLSLLIIVYFGLALSHLTKLPIFVDEALYLRWAQIAWHDASWRFISLTDGKQPLYIWFVIPFMKGISDPLLAGRFASVVAGLGTVLGMFYLGFLIKDKRLGYLAALLSIFSPFLFFYYRFAVMESLLTAFGVWVLNLSILLARTIRLDIALILGMTLGLSLLVKSSALFYFLFFPFAYLLVINQHSFFSRHTFKFLVLVIISALLAQIINNIQRLSPWMHMISQKNAFFTVPYSQIFADPQRIFHNFIDVWHWHLTYTTWPIVLIILLGYFLLLKNNLFLTLYLSLWSFAALLGTSLVARLYAPRYIVFITPYLIIFAAYFLSSLSSRMKILLTTLVLIWPALLVFRLITDPLHFPYVSVDEGYVNGWSAGNGTQQIAAYLINQSQDKKITVFTEGTFGILPQGLELYTDGKTNNNLEIIGIYPLDKIPPQRVLQSAQTKPTFLILNNTPLDKIPPHMQLVASYPKLRHGSMRLYRIVMP